MSLDLVPLLERVEKVAQSEDVNAILDLIPLVEDTHFGKAILRDLGPAVRGSEPLMWKLLQTLDLRFRAHRRDLHALDCQVLAIREFLIPELPSGASLQLRLLWTAVAFHIANHKGNPDLVRQAAERFEAQRAEAFPNERELVANLDCKLAIHYADRFEFTEAQKVLGRLMADPAFPYLELWTRGVVRSSFGQVCGMLGKHDDAEQSFLEADREFAAASFRDPEQQFRERRRTATYRAINAIDAGWRHAIRLTEEVTEPLRHAAAAFAGLQERVFEHHLFLRCLSNVQPNTGEQAGLLRDGRDTYLRQEARWISGDHHPWELIEMYRAILLFQQRQKSSEAVVDRLDQAADLAASPQYGDTLLFIRAMICTVGHHLTGEARFEEQAREAVELVEERFDGVAAAMRAAESFRRLLDSPAPAAAAEIVRVLPFNYH